jgi:hypothetical protein
MAAFDFGQLTSLRSLTEVFGPMCPILVQVLAPSDQVGAGDLAHLLGTFDAGEGRELLDVIAVRPRGAGVVQVREPLQLGVAGGKPR